MLSELDLVLAALCTFSVNISLPTTNNLIECLVFADVLDFENIRLVCMEFFAVYASVTLLLHIFHFLHLNGNRLANCFHLLFTKFKKTIIKLLKMRKIYIFQNFLRFYI